MLIPSYRLLPEPSILEKLQKLNPDAGHDILENFARIAEERRARQAAAPAGLSLLKTFTRAFRDGFFYYFRPHKYLSDSFGNAATKDPFAAASAAINRDWAVTGDDLRAAINDYLRAHKLTPQQLGLTDKETKSLHYVAQDYTPGCQRPPSP